MAIGTLDTTLELIIPERVIGPVIPDTLISPTTCWGPAGILYTTRPKVPLGIGRPLARATILVPVLSVSLVAEGRVTNDIYSLSYLYLNVYSTHESSY